MFDATENWCKIWRKTELCFQQLHKKLSKFSLEHMKLSKFRLWWDPFIQSKKFMSLKFAGELCFMKIENDEEFEEELTCQF